jgi:arabinofuranan 3-O-arabinosyltransferase
LRTDRVTLTFPLSGATESKTLPVGVADLVIDGLEGLTYAPDPNGPTGAQCGLGPAVTVDGQAVRTRVTGRISDVVDGAALKLVTCGKPLVLAAGEHQLAVAATDRFAPTTVILTADQPGPGSGERSSTSDRRTEIRHWAADDRTVYVGPGAAALLRIPENVNAGWRATLNGKVLEPTVIDGWQQAYRVPAGDGGLVRLTYRPDAPYRLMLLLGGIGGTLLLLGALVARLRDRRRAPLPAALPESLTGTLGGTLPRGVLAALLLGAAWLAGGVPLLAGAAVALGLRSRGALVRNLAIASIAVAGLAAAVLAEVDTQASWTALDAVTGAGLGMLLVSVTGSRIMATTGED